MTKYHINRESGELGVCRADKRTCPVGDAQDHFGSEAEGIAEIERRFEQRYADAFLGAAKSKMNIEPAEAKTEKYLQSYVAQKTSEIPGVVERTVADGEIGIVSTPPGTGKINEILRSAKDRGISTSVVSPRDFEAWNFDNFKPADLLILDEFPSEDDARAFASSLDRTQYKSIIISQHVL